MIDITITDKVSKKLEKLSKGIDGKKDLSVMDACRYCSQLWKTLIPKKTGRTSSNINYVVNRGKGKVISPAQIKPRSFYLNQFLEGNYGGKKIIKAGATNTIVKGRPYNLRTGIFGAGGLAAKMVAPHFKGLITNRILGLIK